MKRNLINPKCKSCGVKIPRKGNCLKCNDSLNIALDRAYEVHSEEYTSSEYTFDDFLKEEGIYEEIEASAKEQIDQRNKLSWIEVFYYKFIKREFKWV